MVALNLVVHGRAWGDQSPSSCKYIFFSEIHECGDQSILADAHLYFSRCGFLCFKLRRHSIGSFQLLRHLPFGIFCHSIVVVLPAIWGCELLPVTLNFLLDWFWLGLSSSDGRSLRGRMCYWCRLRGRCCLCYRRRLCNYSCLHIQEKLHVRLI